MDYKQMIQMCVQTDWSNDNTEQIVTDVMLLR